MTPRVTLCVPIYRGARFLPELGAALCAQTLREFTVTLSIDGEDDAESIEAARALTADSRFILRINPQRQGWSAHAATLLRAAETEYACYMPQDDLPEPEYLRVMLLAAEAMPLPGSVFTDLRYFGTHSHVETNDGTGHAERLERMRTVLARQPWIPARGLVPRALAAGGLFAPTTPAQIAEDHVAGLRMAIFGPLLRIAAPLYRKSVHATNAGARWLRWDAAQRRAAWMELGIRLLEVALPEAANPQEARLLWEALFHRHCLPVPGRHEFWIPDDQPEAITAFTQELLEALAARGHGLAAVFGDDAPGLARAALARARPG